MGNDAAEEVRAAAEEMTRRAQARKLAMWADVGRLLRHWALAQLGRKTSSAAGARALDRLGRVYPVGRPAFRRSSPPPVWRAASLEHGRNAGRARPQPASRPKRTPSAPPSPAGGATGLATAPAARHRGQLAARHPDGGGARFADAGDAGLGRAVPDQSEPGQPRRPGRRRQPLRRAGHAAAGRPGSAASRCGKPIPVAPGARGGRIPDAVLVARHENSRDRIVTRPLPDSTGPASVRRRHCSPRRRLERGCRRWRQRHV